MAVAEIIQALSGSYGATQNYSFEFRERNTGLTITELFFLLPPKSVRVRESTRSDLMATLGGGYIADYGNAPKEISVQGEIHFFYAGTLGGLRPPGRTSDTEGNFVTGYEEFVKMRFMLMRYRDYTLTARGKLKAPLFANPQLAPAELLKRRVMTGIGRKKGALADQIQLIWHDYDYDDHFLVKVDDLDMERASDDVWTVQYSFSMLGFQLDPRRSSQQFSSAASRRVPALEQIRKVTVVLGSQHPESAPGTLVVQLNDSPQSLPAQITPRKLSNTIVLP